MFSPRVPSVLLFLCRYCRFVGVGVVVVWAAAILRRVSAKTSPTRARSPSCFTSRATRARRTSFARWTSMSLGEIPLPSYSFHPSLLPSVVCVQWRCGTLLLWSITGPPPASSRIQYSEGKVVRARRLMPSRTINTPRCRRVWAFIGSAPGRHDACFHLPGP